MPTLAEDADKLAALKADYDEKNSVAKAAELAFKEFQATTFERMRDEGVESLRVNGVTFSPVAKEYATMQDKEAFIAWARENDEDLIKEAPRDAELNALVRRCLDDKEELPPGVGYYTREYISQRTA